MNKPRVIDYKKPMVHNKVHDRGEKGRKTRKAIALQLLEGRIQSAIAKSLKLSPSYVSRQTRILVRDKILIPIEGGKKRRETVECWIEVVDNSDRHIEKHPVVKRWIASGGLKDIYKIRVKDFPPTMTQEQVWKELEYRLPE